MPWRGFGCARSIGGRGWQAETADPADAAGFLATGRLVLRLRRLELLNPANVFFSIPTVSNEFPRTTAEAVPAAFEIELHEDDYRQLEFLPARALPLIELKGTVLLSREQPEFVQMG